MSVKKIHLFPSEESYVANSGSVEADDVALVPLVLAPVAKSGSFNDLNNRPQAYITEAWRSGTAWHRVWSKEALQKPLFPSRIEQNCSVRFFFTTSKNGVFLPLK